MKKVSVLVVLAFVVTACHSRYSSNGEQLYLRSQNGEALIVPPPLTSENVSHFYDLPSQTQNAQVNIDPPIEPITTS